MEHTVGSSPTPDTMGKTYKQQAIYNELHDLPNSHNWSIKIQKFFNRINFWDWDLKISWRQHKDFKQGNENPRVKKYKYKNH